MKNRILLVAILLASVVPALAADKEEKVEDLSLIHIFLKADVRDSSRLTRSLMEKG